MDTMDAAHRWLTIARDVLSWPTAPEKEDLPIAYLEQFAATHKSLRLSRDHAGNVLLKYAGRNAARSTPLVLVAHLDHPGFWIQRVAGKKVELQFHGGVHAEHVPRGTGVQFFTTDSAVETGCGKIIKVRENKGRLEGATAELTEGEAVPRGFAMWDFPGFELKNGLIGSRACDDLLGATAALCVLHELNERRPANTAVWALFTRAEEVGFFGALEAVRLKTLPRKAAVISLECSKALPHAAQGNGVIVRVGDRSSIFDPELSEALRAAAERVASERLHFKYQRKLMDGGSCEATAFCAHGYRSSGLCVPMENYHNQAFTADGKPAIGPETVRVDDFVAEVQLLLELATHPNWLASRDIVPAWLKERAERARQALSSARKTTRRNRRAVEH